MARSRDCKSIRYDSAIDGHCAACSSSNLRQASSNRRSMSRGWLAERTGTTRPRRRRRAVRHTPYLAHRTHQLALRARRGSQQERHRLSAGPQRKPSSSFFSRDARQCAPGSSGGSTERKAVACSVSQFSDKMTQFRRSGLKTKVTENGPSP